MNKWNAITSVFSGKGGTIRLAIVSALVAAVVYEVVEAKYGVTVTTKDGSVSLAPADGAAIQQAPEALEIPGEGDAEEPEGSQQAEEDEE